MLLGGMIGNGCGIVWCCMIGCIGVSSCGVSVVNALVMLCWCG